MRGKEWIGFDIDRVIGITPAYAGKSEEVLPVYAYLWDHPRLCGEKFCYAAGLVGNIGSPPPMRGKDRQAVQQHQHRRITPAYAGKRLNGAKASLLG